MIIKTQQKRTGNSFQSLGQLQSKFCYPRDSIWGLGTMSIVITSYVAISTIQFALMRDNWNWAQGFPLFLWTEVISCYNMLCNLKWKAFYSIIHLWNKLSHLLWMIWMQFLFLWRIITEQVSIRVQVSFLWVDVISGNNTLWNLKWSYIWS